MITTIVVFDFRENTILAIEKNKQGRGTPCAPPPSVFILFLVVVCLLAFYRHFSILGHEAYSEPEVSVAVVVRIDTATVEAEVARVVAKAKVVRR